MILMTLKVSDRLEMPDAGTGSLFQYFSREDCWSFC